MGPPLFWQLVHDEGAWRARSVGVGDLGAGFENSRRRWSEISTRPSDISIGDHANYFFEGTLLGCRGCGSSGMTR